MSLIPKNKIVTVKTVGELCINCVNGANWTCADGSLKIVCREHDTDTKWNQYCLSHKPKES